jgi:SAM-dependent methyltransferase
MRTPQEDYCKPGESLPFALEYVACDLCGSQRQRPVYLRRDRDHPEYAFRLVECLDCGLAFVNPRPTFESLGFFYSEDFYAEMALPIRRRSYENRLKYLGRDTSKTVLDIGCGRGDFPLFLQQLGWQVEGHEMVCPTLLPGVTIYTMPLADLARSGRMYDLVCSWAVFEHLTRPSLYFQAVRDLVKPNGVFIFLVTNFESPASRHFRQEDIPRHLYVFSPKTCEAYLKKYGFKLEKVYHNDEVFRLNHPHALQWLWCKITGESFDDYSFMGYQNPAEANNPLETIKIWSYNITNKIIDRALRVICRMLNKNGIITLVTKKQ